ncbi:MAG: hypothetical protein D084_Lepto4C00415G0008 [Leptospirillum sp. Group IV 'UBA BS']|nr:MAG: hypothetical protein D084_Lepto4C00415G0008 [Leptospirillum sp. Group IV 'UBA BS']
MSQYYASFPQVEDDEVRRVLARTSGEERASPQPPG